MTDPLHSVMLRDLHRLRAARRRRTSGKAVDLAAAIAASESEAAQRRASVPAVSLPPELPITAHADRIKQLLAAHQVLIVAGETGSGKTTQLPKLCLQAGFGARGMIGHTQPRRLAARTVARRIAEELGVPLGGVVGYAVRFTDRTSAETLVKVMTDGLLLSEVRSDRFLDHYEVIIVDEAHERSLNVDFLLGYLQRLLPKRPQLKLIITSATIDVDSFAAHFAAADGTPAPIVEVGGRGFPVDVVYRDPAESELSPDAALVDAIREIERMPRRGADDILVFQTGEREIFEAAKRLRREFGERFDVLPLYARLPVREQNRIFARGGRRRIVLATNVAETSLTVPNIGFVVDPGFARISRYSFHSKLQRLPVEPISCASADQRKGRCGRVAPGICVRLYSEADFVDRPAFTDPEIRRTNLASVVLQMRALDLGEPARFPFIDPPDPRAVNDALRLLHELQALEHDRLTATGRLMARMPVDPRLARMLIEGERQGSLAELLVIVSALAIQDPRERPLDRQAQADEQQREFADSRSDFLAFLKLWAWYDGVRQRSTRSELEQSCRERFLAPMRMREWRELHRQLLITIRELGMRPRGEPASYEAIHRALLTGSLGQVALKQDGGEYLAARQTKCWIFPGSALFRRGPKWIMAAEISETQRVYARCVGAIEPRWVEAAAAHLIKRRVSDPFWDAQAGEVLGYERVTLYGLVLVERRPVSYRDVDRAVCREIFLRDGLRAGALAPAPVFVQHNAELLEQVRELEAKGRRRDLLVEDAVQVEFYAERVPQDIIDAASFTAWYRRAQQADPHCLFMTRADLLKRLDLHELETGYPSDVELDGIEFRLKYAFAPGAPDDGISLQVPVGMLGHLRAEPLDWLVPGFLHEKCEALVRSLPKSVRRPLAPVPEKIEAVVPALVAAGTFRQGRLELALAEQMQQRYDVRIPATAWRPEQLPDHLRLNYQVRDAQGRLVDQGRDLAALVARYRERLTEGLDAARRDAIEQFGLTQFPPSGLEQQVVIDHGAGPVVAYPALRDDGDSVALILAESAAAQHAHSMRGCARLVLLAEKQTARYLKSELRKERDLALQYAPLGSWEQLQDTLQRAAVRQCFFADGEWPRTPRQFDERLARGRGEWLKVFWRVLRVAREILTRRLSLVRALDETASPAFASAVDDIRRQIDRLIGPDFLERVSLEYLERVPRYLDAAAYRVAHLQGRVAKDQQAQQLVHGYEKRLDAVADMVSDRSEYEAARFALEELRVALFAQAVGTREKASPQRVERMLVPLEQRAGLR